MEKAKRNWREFLKEYAIIVVGVLTALAAQQAAETLNARSRAAEARVNIRAEIAHDLRLMNMRAATEACIAKRLGEVDARIAASAAGPKESIWIGNPQAYAMLESRYQSATQSGAVSLFSDQEQAGYARLYGFLAIYFQMQVEEQKAWADLRILEEQPPSSAELDVKLRSAIKQARINRYQIQRIHHQIMSFASTIGLEPEPVGRIETQSVCLPLNTPPAEAQRMIIKDRKDGGTYDLP